nr:streptophobe family protein [Streptomyces poonensis]
MPESPYPHSPGSPGSPAVPAPGRRAARHGWTEAVATVLAGLVAMAVVAGLGLWAAGAADLPDNAFPRVVAAAVVSAVGGAVELSGDMGSLADSRGGLVVMPLSVTLVGALVIGAGFLRPLRHRAVAGAPELAGWAARIAVLWLLVLIGAASLARQTFRVPLGDGLLDDLGELFGLAPTAGFTTDVPRTVLFGLLWLAGVFVLALLVSPGAPLPARLVRLHGAVRPAAYAMLALLLAYVVVGLVIALVVAATREDAAGTFAVILLGLPNLVWFALTIGLGASWTGRVDGPFALPLPRLLDEALRTSGESTLNVRTLAEHDGRVWWLVVVAAVLLLAAAGLAVSRSPARVRPWQHAVRLAVALVATVLMICSVGRISAHYGLSVPVLGDLGTGLSGEVSLRPLLWSALGFAALWGLVAGALSGVSARGVRRRP